MKRQANHFSELTETAAGSGVYTNENYSVRMQQVYGYPNYITCLVITDGVTLSNTLFSVWETAPQSGVYRNYHPAIPTNLDPADIAMPDFVPWQLKIGGVTDTSLVSQVTITTLVDSTNQVTFSVVKGSLLSDKKFILIPDETPEAPPPQGYVSLRTDTLQSKWWDEEQKNITASVTLASKTRAPDTTLEKLKKDRPGALVPQSFRWFEDQKKGLDTENNIAKPLEEMGYAVTRRYKATKTETLSKDIKGKQIWYSTSHGSSRGARPNEPFQGLWFMDGWFQYNGIVASDLLKLNLNFKLVIVDACSSAQTALDYTNALKEDTLLPHARAFADAFGTEGAYVGWAWKNDAKDTQKYSSEFINNLKFDPAIGRARTVLEAYRQVLKNHDEGGAGGIDELTKTMKLHPDKSPNYDQIIDTRKKE